MTTTPLRKTKSTLLSLAETEKAAAAIKLLGSSRGYTRYSDLHTVLAANGYPASYATFARLMRAARPAQSSELTPIARFFNLAPEDLTGVVANPLKDAAPPRLVEYDLPAPEQAEAPQPALAPRASKPRASAGVLVDGAALLALADAITELTLALRGTPRPSLKDVLQNAS